jgi:hypothetical protein
MTMKGCKLILEAESSTTINTFRVMIQQKRFTDIDNLNLIFRGKELHFRRT